MWIHWPLFPKTWTKGRWPLDDLWPHVCWGHMCDFTQGSLCPSPITIHQCMWTQWSIFAKYHIHTTYCIHTIYYVHTTYRMSDHIVSYWTQFRRDKNGPVFLQKSIKIGTFFFENDPLKWFWFWGLSSTLLSKPNLSTPGVQASYAREKYLVGNYDRLVFMLVDK